MAIKRTVTKAKPTKRRPPGKARPSRGSNGWPDVLPGVTWDEHAGPWILNLLVVPAAGMLARTYVFHTWFGRGAAVAGIAIVGFMLTFALWHEAHARGGWTQARIGITTAYCTLGLAGSVIWAWDLTWLKIVGFVGVAVSAWWTAAGTRPMRGNGDDQHDQRDTLAEQLGIPGTTAKLIPTESGGARKTFGLLHRDATIDAIRGAAGLIGSKLGVPATGVRVIEDPNDGGRSKLVITDRDVLAAPAPWPGPSAPGTSIGASPCRIGVREDSTWETIIRPGQEPDEKRGIDARPNGHSISGGMTRSGKTEGELCEVAEIATRTEVALFWSDTVKPDQTLRDFAPACNRVATDRRKTQLMVDLVVRSIKPRSRYLGMRDHRQWEPGCGLTYLVVHFEELAAVAELLGDNLRKVVAEAGSVGISLSGSMQRPSSYLLETDTRAQFSINWCYGMRNDTDAAMVLSDSTMDAGAHPEAWKNTKPGYNYLEASHIPDHEWSMPCRTFRLPGNVLRDHVAVWADRMDDLDEVTQKAMGPSLDDLPRGTNYALGIGWRRTSTGILVPPGQDPTTYKPRETVSLQPATRPAAQVSWTETGGGDEDRDGTRDGAGDEPRHGRDEGGDDDESGAALELEAAVKDVANEVAAEHPMDPEMRQDITAALAAGEPGTPLDGDYEPGEDFELEVGTPGPPPTYPQRVEALAVILWQLIARSAADALADVEIGDEIGREVPPIEVSTDDLVTAWYRVPGIRPGQRPALYRLLKRLERAGQVEDLGRGGWRVHAGATNWLRDNLADSPDDDTDGDDEGESLAGVL